MYSQSDQTPTIMRHELVEVSTIHDEFTAEKYYSLP